MKDTPIISVRSEPDALLTKRHLATRLNRSGRWIEFRVADGTLPAIKLGRTILFSWPDVLQALSKFRVN